jgi:asparagine synthase (glutamine-hydrolysing)
MVTVYDEPFADSSHIPTFVISQFARRYVKVVLSGDGGDELLGGYSRYIALAASERVRGSALGWMLLRALSRVSRERVRALHHGSVALGLAYRWSDLAVRSAMCQVNIGAAQRRALWGGRRPAGETSSDGFVTLPDTSVSGLNRAFHFDLTCYLPGDILVKVDRAAMAHGLETRAPFLDRDLAEFVLRLPASLKVSDYDLKIVFRAACADLWPEIVRRRGKQGFGAPYVRWLTLPEVRALTRRVFAAHGPLRALLPGLPKNPPPNYATWTLLTLGLWLERHECAW